MPMIGLGSSRRAILKAIDRSQAIIEFGMDGTILTANSNFLEAFGYTLSEIKGRHHSLFLGSGEDVDPAYEAFWDDLRRGLHKKAEYRRLAKGGREVWIQASYNPVLGWIGQPVKVVKLATIITGSKRQSLEDDGKLQAIDKSQAVIELALDGTILDANENFCLALGYASDEIRGLHHSIFVDPADRDGAGYAEFWATLRSGAYQQAEYRRIAKDGRDVWIQASYNPILDSFGRPLKIVKLATDVTDIKRRSADDRGKIEAIDKSQATVELALDGTILSANDNFLRAMGYGIEEIQGKHHGLFVSSEERDGAAYKAFWDTLRQGRYQAGEYRRIGKDGRNVWIQASYNPIFDLRGKPIKIFKIATDITAEVERREQVQLLSLVADETSNSVVITDANGVIEYVNAGFVRMTGYSFDEVRGRRPGVVLQGPETSGETRDELREKIRRQHPCYHEILNYTKAGDPYWISLFINPVKDVDGRVSRFISIQTNVTERKQTEERLAFIARHDALTGLANRTLFRERLVRALENGQPVALLCLDLDRFKLVNDTLGHPAGDELLRQVAERLRRCTRESDTIARLGGDEFAVIYGGFDAEQAVRVLASYIVDRIAAPFSIASYPIEIGVSIGIALASGSESSSERMIEEADRALYWAKSAGRGTFRTFEPEMANV